MPRAACAGTVAARARLACPCACAPLSACPIQTQRLVPRGRRGVVPCASFCRARGAAAARTGVASPRAHRDARVGTPAIWHPWYGAGQGGGCDSLERTGLPAPSTQPASAPTVPHLAPRYNHERHHGRRSGYRENCTLMPHPLSGSQNAVRSARRRGSRPSVRLLARLACRANQHGFCMCCDHSGTCMAQQRRSPTVAEPHRLR